MYRFHHSVEIVRLLEPTNWIEQLRCARASDDRFDVLGSARIRPEDLRPNLIEAKTETYGQGVKIMRNHWVQGSGYLLRYDWVERYGLLQPGQSWTAYCLDLALTGAMNGYLLPFIFVDHMDDPRSETHCFLQTKISSGEPRCRPSD